MMDLINIVGLGINLAGIGWAFFAHRQNEKLKGLIVTEKDMIRDRILDIGQTLKSHRDKVLADRKNQGDPTLNTLHIRIEDIEGMIENLDRFADRLQELK
jgi:hypothetical protein